MVWVCGRTFLCGVAPSSSTTALSLLSIVVTTRRTSALKAITRLLRHLRNEKAIVSLLGLPAKPGLMRPALALPNEGMSRPLLTRITSDGGSHLPLDHHALDLSDRLGRIETLRAGFGAIHDGVAAVEAERILEIVEAPPRRLVAAVLKPAVGLQQRGRSHETLAIPPIARARG